MPIQQTRIGLTLAPETAHLLGDIAKETHQSTATLAKELILEALENREDIALARLAEIRSIENKTTVEHSDVWK